MRLLLVALALLAAVVIVTAEEKNQDRFSFKNNRKWTEYKKKHLKNKKKFHSDDHEKSAFEAFSKNDDMITKHNRQFELGQQTFKMDHNEMTSMTPDELKSVTGAVMPEVDLLVKNKRAVTAIAQNYVNVGLTTPASVDWRDIWTTDTRQQGSCGSCWAFATAGQLESQILSAYGIDKADVSEQFLVDCSYLDNGCNGGWPTNTMQLVAQDGFTMEANSPYISANGTSRATCNYSPYARLADQKDPVLGTAKAAYPVTAVYKIADGQTKGWEVAKQQMKDALAYKSVLFACVYVNSAFQAYSGGVFRYASAAEANTTCNHAILVTGYGVDPVNGAYWIIRNSWGGWGELGHMRLSQDTLGPFLRNAAFAYMAGSSTIARKTPPLNIAEGQHRMQIIYNNMMADANAAAAAAAAARAAEIATGCYDSDVGIKWPCSSFTGYCSGGIMTVSYSNGLTSQYSIPNECKKTCNKCSMASG